MSRSVLGSAARIRNGSAQDRPEPPRYPARIDRSVQAAPDAPGSTVVPTRTP